MNKTISVIVPTYNERENIVPLVERIHQAIGTGCLTSVMASGKAR